MDTINREDKVWMRRCLQLARCGLYGAPPNPMVGAVIVCNGKILGEGFHRKCGEGHAEVNAFASVKREDLLAQATMYVSLEPCSHYGKTPPCAQLIIDKGVPKVVVGCVDPFARVHGEGVRMLRAAGVDVKVGVLEKECLLLNRHFIIEQKLGRPYVLLKWAESADGFIDKNRMEGQAVRLSTSHSLLRVHLLRAESQAILVGKHTALLDNPHLNIRVMDGPQPLRVVLDRQGILPSDLYLFDGSQPTMVIGEQDNIERKKKRKYDFVRMNYREGSILPQLLQVLKKRGIQTLLVEGGATLLQSFMDENLWDEIHVEKSAKVLSDGVAAPKFLRSIQLKEELSFGVKFSHAYRPESEFTVLEK